MEFYFGDANLNKDRFMKEEIAKNADGCKWPSSIDSLQYLFYSVEFLDVDLEVFLRFNRVAAMTKDIKLIAAALEKSETLKVFIVVFVHLATSNN
jgi:lupus La protein